MNTPWKALSRKIGLGFALAAAAAAFLPGAAQAQKSMSWGTSGDVDTMDVHIAGTVASWAMYQMVYETLLTTDKDLNLRPGLAESWKQNSPTSYTLSLRRDAKWSNGRPLVATDVVGSLERISGIEMNPAGVAAAKTD